MKMVLVDTAEHKREFLDFPKRLYASDPEYIIPIDNEIEQVFDPNKNKFFKLGEAQRWLCVNDKNETIGKLATFYHSKYKMEQATGGIGFFDCIDDVEVSRFMFDHCKQWLESKGMEAMDGPINFGERDKWWGLLVEGFKEPLYGMNYNFPYYQKLFEDYGFQVYFYQLCFGRGVHSPLSENFKEAHDKIEALGTIHIERVSKDKIIKYAHDFTDVYNQAWAAHGGGKQLEKRVAEKMFTNMKPVINEFTSFIAYEGEKPIGMWINLPNLNDWFKLLKGKFSWWHKLRFLWLKTNRPGKHLVGLVFGVIPEWQKKGIDGFLIWKGAEFIRKYTSYEHYEMQWIGDFNPKMISIAKTLETEVTRKLATYRYLFDRNKPFERHPIL